MVTKKKTAKAEKRFEILSTRLEDKGREKAAKLSLLIGVEKGVPVAVADAVIIALEEAIKRRSGK